MSGVAKKAADVAFKAGRTIDREGMAKLLVTDEAWKEFSTLRRAFDEVNTQLPTKFSQIRSDGIFAADVAFKAGRTIDREGMAKLLVTDEAWKEFSTLRRAFDEVNTQLPTKFSQEPEPVDWEYYRKGIGSRLVDVYKQAYDGRVEIFKAGRTIDREGMAKLLVTDEAWKEFSTLRRAFDEVNTQLPTKFSQIRSDGIFAADVAFKAGRTIDREGMAKLLVTDEAWKEFSTLRRAFDEVNTQLPTKFSQIRSDGIFAADVAFKAGRTIDREGMAKLLVTDEAWKEFSTLRRAFDEVNTQLPTKFSQEPEPVDWEYYRKGIGSRLVDVYKQAYDGRVEIFKAGRTIDREGMAKLLVTDEAWKEFSTLRRAFDEVNTQLPTKFSQIRSDGIFAADVAFKAGRTIDREGMAKLLVTDEAWKEFSTLRRAFDEVNTQLPTKFSQDL